MSISSEIALFVSIKKATAACEAATSQKEIKGAAPYKRYSRGQLLGYEVGLETTDGVLMSMSEDFAEGIFG